MAEQIIFYTSKACPFAQRVAISLEEVGAKYTPYNIDLQNKPEWYAARVHPGAVVPAIAYGGSSTDPTNPSPESIKIPESLILVEFVADLFRDTAKYEVLPKDPVKRARIRLFIDAVNSKLGPSWGKFIFGGTEGAEGILAAVEKIQALLPDDGGFVLGGDEFSTADIVLGPLLARLEISSKNDAGKFQPGEGTKVWQALSADDKFQKYRTWLAKFKERESFKKTFDEAHITESYLRRFRS